jgi:hypothetical protein
MPIETYKDPQTGEERRRWVAPQATAPKPAAPKPQAAKPAAPKPAPKPKDDGFDLGDLARGALNLVTSAAENLPPVQLAKEAVKAGPAVQGAYESVGRATLSGARQLVQEGYDYVNDELSKVGLTTATTAEKPDAPLPILGAPLPKVEGLSKGEEIVGNVLALGAGFLATRGAMGKAGRALAKTPVGAPVAQQAAKVTGKVSALRNTPIPAVGQPGRAAAVAKKAAGLVIEEGSQGAVAGAVSAYVLEDPWSGNLSNALKGTPLESPFSRWTQTGPGDSSQEARFKNAVTDFVYGIPFGIGLGAAGDAIKAATAKTITKTVKVAVAEEAATRAAADVVPTQVRQVEPQGTVDIDQPIRDPEGRVEPTVDPVEKARVELEDAQRELQELAAREMEPPAPPAAAVVEAPATVVDAPAAAPVKLYRGTKAGSEGSPTVGDGFFMTPDRKVAEAYAGKGGNVTEQDVSFGNLLEAPTWMKAKQQLGLAKSATMDDLIRAARDAGYDGLSFTTKNGKEYVQIPGAAVIDVPTAAVAEPSVPSAGTSAPVAQASPQEVQELDAMLAKSMANLSPEQRVAVRDQMLAEKYGTGSPDEPVFAAGDGGMEPPAPPEVRPAVEPPDPEDFARRINENIDAIRSGDMDLQEAMSGNVRRYISRSGKTVYRPSAPEEMIATNRALSDMLTSRADATGIASYSVDDVYQEAARRLNRDGLNVELTIQRMEAARAGDPRSQEDLVTQAALILHRDDMAQQNGIAAIEFQNNVDEGVKADAMRRLWAGYEDQLKLDGALMAATRKDAQRLRLNQGPDRVRLADGATPAPDLPDQTVQQIADQEIANPANSLMDKLDPEIRADIENGVLGPDAEAMTDLLSRVVITSRDTKGVGPRFAAKMKEVPTGRLTQDFILQAYRSSLLYSMKTMMKMTLGSGYRSMTLGASQAFGALGDAALQGARGNARGSANALRRAGLDMGIYLRMMSELPHALRLAGHSIKEGESFGNLGRNQMEMAQRGFTEADQAVLDAPEFAENVTRETTLNNPFFLDPENKNATAQFMRKAWQTYSFSGRVAGSLDTFFSSLVGPSAEWARLMDLQLRQAEDLGMAPMKAWSWATDKTEELLDAQWAKVVTQGGSVIENGALTGKHAQVVMDWTNFTDPLDIKFQDRSYEYGIRVAKDEGLTDPAEIAARAQEWVNETPDAWKRAGMGVGNVVGLAPKLFQEAVNNVPVLGMLQAFNRGPTNIVKAGMRATGFAAPLADTFWRDINSEDIFTRDRAIGEIATGWLTAVTAVTLATSGFVQLSGPGSLNPQVRQKMRNEGTRPFAIRFRNPTTDEWSAWWDLSPFDSVATIFAGVATYMDTANNMPTENREAMGNSLTLTIAETVRQVGAGQFTKGMYGGIMDIFDMFSDLETKSFIPVEGQIGAFEEFIQKKLTGFMPATFRNIRRGQDPYERVITPGDWPSPFNGLQELGYRFMNEIPGLSENLPPRLHPITASPVVGEQVWGTNFIPPEQPWMRGLVQAFSPTAGMPFTMGSVDPVDNELKKLSGRGTAFIVWNANEFQIPNYRLDINRLNRLAEITRDYVPPGRTTSLHGELTALIGSAEYQALPEATPSRATESARAIQINKVINYYKGFIKEEFRAQDPEVNERLTRIEKQKLMNQNDAQMGIEAWTRRLTR